MCGGRDHRRGPHENTSQIREGVNERIDRQEWMHLNRDRRDIVTVTLLVKSGRWHKRVKLRECSLRLH